MCSSCYVDRELGRGHPAGGPRGPHSHPADPAGRGQPAKSSPRASGRAAYLRAARPTSGPRGQPAGRARAATPRSRLPPASLGFFPFMCSFVCVKIMPNVVPSPSIFWGSRLIARSPCHRRREKNLEPQKIDGHSNVCTHYSPPCCLCRDHGEVGAAAVLN